MSNNIKILKNYLLYFLLMILVCIIGISGVFADTISDYSTKYYYYRSNDNSSIDSTVYRSGDNNYVTLFGADPPAYNNGEGFNGFYNQINYKIVKGSIYTLTLNVQYTNLLDSEFYRNDINNRLLTTDFAHCDGCNVTAVSGNFRRYNNISGVANNLYDFVVQMSYTFVATYTTNTFYIGSYTGDDRVLGVDNHLYNSIVSVYSLEINENNSSTIINQNDTIINQNNQIIEQNNQNTQDIINNNNTNTNNIINNQNQNTQEQIESQQVCQKIDQSDIIQDNTYLRSNGTLSEGTSYFGITDYIDIKNISTLKRISSYGESSSASYCFYNIDKTLISCSTIGGQIGLIDIPSNAYYFRTSMYIRQNVYNSNTPSYEICKNGNQALNDNINDLNNTLTDDSPADLSSLSNTLGWLPAGPIDSILNLPINFLNSLLTSLGGTCSPLNITIPYLNTTAEIPCLSTIFNQITGVPSYWNWVGAIASVIILYRYLLSLWAYYDRLTTMQVNFRDDFGGGV